jgi:hypothetical protein
MVSVLVLSGAVTDTSRTARAAAAFHPQTMHPVWVAETMEG